MGIPTDFVNVWAAGRLALDGHPAQAWDWDIQKQVEVALLGQNFTGYFAWHYPPPFLFVASLLAHFPYAVAFIGWALVSLVPYLAMMRAIVGRPFGLLLAVAVPMAFNNVLVGQNGFLTAALIGGTLYLMPVRPVLSGICLGLLSYKPQYGLLFPLVLIAASQWTVFFTAAVVTLAMAFASWLAFGTESWQAFFHWMPMFSQAFLTEGQAPWWKMHSLFALVRTFGGTEQLAWIFHWIFAGCRGGGAGADVAQPGALFAEGRGACDRHLADHALSLHVRHDGAGDPGRVPGPHRAFERLSRYELPALACALAMIVGFILAGVPLGFGATLIVAGLVLRRASRGAARAGAGAAASRPDALFGPATCYIRHLNPLSSALNRCSVLQSGGQIAAQSD